MFTNHYNYWPIPHDGVSFDYTYPRTNLVNIILSIGDKRMYDSEGRRVLKGSILGVTCIWLGWDTGVIPIPVYFPSPST